MPELDKNYLAGLYLDEITLDVMPQEYIDAALEVKLRYDACAPRAGYNCVQDRRVKGGFYYRKAPQGRGVDALPPSKLERALARSQEQPTQRSGMSFLGKAAIGAGVAVGGLALTGAVVNAGRSSEPYQEPVRQKPEKAKTSYNAATIGVAGVAATSVGAAVVGLGKKSKPQEIDDTITPQESAKTKPPEAVKTPEEEEGYKEQQTRNQAIRELAGVGYDTQKRAYEQALGKDLEKAGVTPEGIDQKKKNLQFDDENEGFVRIDQVKENTADGVQLTKAARAKQSEDLQALYDKLKENGVEDAIEFRPAIDKKFKKPLAASANKYTIDLRDGNPPIQVGEMRFRKNKDQIVGATAEKMKPEATRSQPPEKSAKAPKPEVAAKAPDPVKTPSGQEGDAKAKKEQAQGVFANEIRRSASTPDGFVNQSSLMNDNVLKGRLSGNDPAVLIAEGIDEGRIQTKKVGRNTYIRDIEAIPLKDFIAEAKGLSDVKDKIGDRRVKDLNAALDYKTRKATNDDERAGVAELKAAIADIQEVKSEQRVSNKKPPTADKKTPENKAGEERTYGGRPVDLKQATDQGRYVEPDPTQVAKPVSDEQVAESNRELEQSKKEVTQKKVEYLGTENNLGGIPRSQDNVRRPMTQLRDEIAALNAAYANKGINAATFNSKVEAIRNQDIVKDKVSRDTRIATIEQEFEERLATAEAKQSALRRGTPKSEREAIKAEMAQIKEEKKLAYDDAIAQIHREIGIPDLVKEKKKTVEKAPVETPVAPPIAPPVTPAPKAASEANAAAATKPVDPITNPPVIGGVKTYKMNDLTSGWDSKKNMESVQIGDRVTGEKGFNGTVKGGIVTHKLVLSGRDGDAIRAFQKEHGEDNVISSVHHGGFAIKPERLTLSADGEVGLETKKIPTAAPSTSAPAETTTEKKKRSSRNKSTNTAASTATPAEAKAPAPTIDLKTLQGNISEMETTAKTLEETLSRIQAGKKPLQKSQSALNNMGIDVASFGALDPAKQISKLQKAIAYQREQIQKKQQEGRDFVDSLNNDAIAPSESYLSAYHETREKYRRVS